MVHRHVLVGMSDGWMEKYLPPEDENVSNLNTYDLIRKATNN